MRLHNFDLIVSQGRIADRSRNAMRGARLTASALAERYGFLQTVVGTPRSHEIDGWALSLRQASTTLAALNAAVRYTLSANRVPLLIANTCSASLATLPAVASRLPDIKILWVDAHGDFNTPFTTDTGYLGGMVLAAACGLWDSGHGAGVAPENVLIAGIRDSDEEEAANLRSAGVRLLAPSEVEPEAVADFIGSSKLWIHINWDALEPRHVPAAYEVSDGLMPQQLRDVLMRIPHTQIVGIELAEFEAPDNEAECSAAIMTLMEIVCPVLDRFV
ncbi:arginase family protein [Rhizobium sp. VS19-DR104.2]|uniref:arginase family protein n=1 Tax=unclassified Rhizobium TaxID=2613769 RepID=UPI001CC6BD15|nr:MULTISPECIES: arginase family protein [unclassified Rhizobium]MBZ5821469.1 arginase family protein [Rhizobium sp. VS19-DR183]MBZ5763695.1 arginase family protein [Rhizobium sp. VS19-DR96]MBZ5769624.1 arginase family protein [Rhizobium sp. VS19-DR129.2]MBZ5776523.1 arginase family protein [Rhizobium sp. VS19-DRK62.2]MBZ5788309.1 arginase family protein [Rhizobium sp. VS19-DR121]